METTGGSEGSWAPVVVFPDGSPSFVYGFEAGKIWEVMVRGTDSFSGPVSLPNKEVLERMCIAQGYSMDWEDLGDGYWANATFEKSKPKKPGDPRALGKMTVIEGGKEG